MQVPLLYSQNQIFSPSFAHHLYCNFAVKSGFVNSTKHPNQTMNRSPILLLFIFFTTCTKPAQSKIVCNDKGYLEAIPLPLYKCENSVVTRQEYNTQVAQDYIANTRRGARQRAAAALAALNAKETWTFGITSQAMTQKMGSTVSQNEWTFAIASQTMAEAQNVVVYQNQWTLAIDAQAITENVGVAVTQGSVSGTLHTALQNEWTLAIDAQAITANSGITVTQGSVTGTLKTALTGATTSIVIQTVAGVSFVTTADVVIGTSSTATRTTIKLSNIKTARNSGTTTKVIVTAATGVTFVTTSNVMIGSTTILASNIRTATNSLYVTGTLKTALNINSATTTILVQGSISNFVATADLVVGSTTIANTDIKTATNSQSAQGTLQTALVHEWLLDITAQGITEQTGVAVTQGANAGTLKTKLVRFEKCEK